MSFNNIEIEHQRRTILEVLNADPDHSHNDAIIKSALKSVGHTISSDRLFTQLDWLEEQGYVVLNNVQQLIIIKLTQRGQDVATGALSARGIAHKGL